VASANRRNSIETWRRQLVDSSTYKRCRENDDGLSTCEYWDGPFRETQHIKLNQELKVEKENYRLWIDRFAKESDGHIRSALKTLDEAGCCVPCLGRGLFDFLRGQAMLPLRFGQPQSRENIPSVKAPTAPIKKTGRTAIRKMQVVSASHCWALIRGLQATATRPHYKEISVLLQHATSIAAPLRNGVQDGMDFRSIKTDFTPRLLRYRVKVADRYAGFWILYDAQDAEKVKACIGKPFV
jgi:hypothetical protein